MLFMIYQDEFGFTSLCIASQNGHHEVATLLIKKGAVVDYVCKVRSTTGLL